MNVKTSVLEDLRQAQPQLRSQTYFKSSLIALSHAMEDQVLAGESSPLVIATFQQERFYRMEANRYTRIAKATDQVYVLAAPESDFTNHSGHYETIAFNPDEPLSQEWNLVVLGRNYGTCLVCQERDIPEDESRWLGQTKLEIDTARRFEGIWSFDHDVTRFVAAQLLKRIIHYRPELAEKVAQACRDYGINDRPPEPQIPLTTESLGMNPGPFAERLITYLQAGQYKLIKAYRSIAAQEEQERLVNSITTAIRQSLDPQEILKVAVRELGEALDVCRCLVYRCKETDATATIVHEYAAPGIQSLVGETWALLDNPLFQEAIERQSGVFLEDTDNPLDTRMESLATLLQQPTGREWLAKQAQRWKIGAWLMMPILYRGKLLGILELHHCQGCAHHWADDEVALVNTIAIQMGTGLIQAETYAHLEDLNQQLEALERTRSNLIAITGHELRTPLSTIQICLESLASEPDMPAELQKVMLNTALVDAERLRELVQDFLTLSRFESGRVEWNLEPLSLEECIDLALSGVKARYSGDSLPELIVDIPADLPLVQADGEWLVQVLGKLLDNACKFTPSGGSITVRATPMGYRLLKVTVADTGRGIEPARVEDIFERFYQEEGALRRTTGGTGLGLAICRQAIQRWGGQVWAESEGKDRGSRFHFTIPRLEDEASPRASSTAVEGLSALPKSRRSR
ncbi:GAF domain-containing protein [Geitlerinema sp. P-1104]|uniref:DICT sensory domain-containing protein n=1 Tax=Geitlerinema sp. P-1104 TaxID=2546230 RepID=UPI00147730A2|nr:DICT sensory domain-containing protein [Geitlerinema sp. P-1104]NMG59654.1 GAF domain-containing protein [Geitlerinema sp. P-1104]